MTRSKDGFREAMERPGMEEWFSRMSLVESSSRESYTVLEQVTGNDRIATVAPRL
jgi:hypothetical protein